MLGFRLRVAVVAGSVAVLVAGWSGAVLAASAPAGYEIAKQNACLGCHTLDRKLVGPGFREISAKYKGDGGAQATLEKKVRDGGSGVWGVIPMPSHPRMSDADIHTVVAWVLAGAPTTAK
ncbi:cytochrome C [Trinickia dinghuensis]|uniref:Cytochrome C n=1 Tax=Trinickia dinghuensis TaxID=2291023 RepID=A0A3D8JZY4_9BURK|nr:c-type cytochrome [Trinickia dinghuensis]RDU98559.1 cytochrome C [Trinickia dinghuensis]